MAASFRDGAVLGLCLMAMVMVGTEAQLTVDFYDDSCPQIYDIVRSEIRKAVAANPRNAASLVRLHFHDCFVNGCDGSVLLDNTTDFVSEQYSKANNDSLRGLDVIDSIKAKLEDACPQTVSCADIVAIASRDSAVAVGLTPGYDVYFGRRDSLTANISAADEFLPAPFFDYSQLTDSFAAVGLNEVDLVALSGAHTIGRAHCRIVLNPADNTPGIDPTFRQNLIDFCDGDGEKLVNLDDFSPNLLDNWYYKNLLRGHSVLKSDQVLWSTPGVLNQGLVVKFVANPFAFGKQFGLSSIKMGNIQPLTGDEGEIRLKCALVNDATSSTLESTASLVASQ